MATKKAPPERKTWDSYAEYLKSTEWESIRKDVKLRDRDACRSCRKEEDLQCHHWRYPKNWDDDSSENVVLLCKACHEELHPEKQASNGSEYIAQIGRARARTANNCGIIAKMVEGGTPITITLSPSEHRHYSSIALFVQILGLSQYAAMSVEAGVLEGSE